MKRIASLVPLLCVLFGCGSEEKPAAAKSTPTPTLTAAESDKAVGEICREWLNRVPLDQLEARSGNPVSVAEMTAAIYKGFGAALTTSGATGAEDLTEVVALAAKRADAAAKQHAEGLSSEADQAMTDALTYNNTATDMCLEVARRSN